MFFRTLTVTFVASLAIAVPVANPEHFEADPILRISKDSVDSSYAQRREVFRADPILQISRNTADSSYAKRREFFEADPILRIAKDSVDSSYATT
ncbi:hypothetical protein V8E54_006350 [Elaphomyces granulatus]